MILVVMKRKMRNKESCFQPITFFKATMQRMCFDQSF